MARRCVLVGLNRYPDPAHALRGCLNDVRQMRALLKEHFGFHRDGAVNVLLDEQATTQAIRERLAWLVAGAVPGDLLVFHYSGHGSQVPDRDGDEVGDGMDEIICPYDLDWDHPFTDDDFHEIVSGLPAGVHLTVVLDCCHSGTGLREPVGTGRNRFLAPPAGRTPAPGRAARSGPRAMASAPGRIRRFGRRAAAAGAILIAGCRADQSAADALIDGAYHGALTYYLCRALEDGAHDLSYRQLVKSVRATLRAEGFDQVPQLEGAAALLDAGVFTPGRQPARVPAAC